MKKILMGAFAAVIGAMITGCASTPLSEKVATWQNERPYATAIQTAHDNGRRVVNSDVALVFTMEEFKKELPEASANLEPVLTLAKTALNVGAELGNGASPLYVGAVESVDRKWADYVGRDVENSAGGDIEKYCKDQGITDPAVVALTKKDWEMYQKVIKLVPDAATLAKGKAVCERFTTTNEKGEKVLDVIKIEMLPYSGKESDKADYNAFLTYRDHTPEVQALYDNALMVQLQLMLAKIQAQMNDLLAAAQKVKEDPEVAKLDLIATAQTMKGLGVGIKKCLEDPLSKVNSSISGFSLASDIKKLAENTQAAEKKEADAAKKD